MNIFRVLLEFYFSFSTFKLYIFVIVANVMRWASWYRLYNLKNVKITHGGVLILVKLQVSACNFTRINTPLWVFFTFFKLYKRYQIAQHTTNRLWKAGEHLYSFLLMKLLMLNKENWPCCNVLLIWNSRDTSRGTCQNGLTTVLYPQLPSSTTFLRLRYAMMPDLSVNLRLFENDLFLSLFFFSWEIMDSFKGYCNKRI